MGKRYPIWRRSRIGSALVRVRQPICSERSAMATYLFHSSGLKHYSTIRLLTLRVKFNGIWRRTLELERLPWTAFIRCIWNTMYSFSYPSRKNASFSDLYIFCLLSSTKSVPICLLARWKYKQNDIFISPCQSDPSQLQNCRIRRFFKVFETLRGTWRQHRDILSPTHPHTPKQIMFCLFVASSNVSLGLTHCTASTVVPKYAPHLVYSIVQCPAAAAGGSWTREVFNKNSANFDFEKKRSD